MSSKKINPGQVFQALGDPTRRAIVEMLSERPYSVSALAAPLEISLTAVAQHLEVLAQSGLARTEKTGRVRLCRIDTAGLAVLDKWIQDRRSLWMRRLDRLGDILATPD